MPSNRPPLIDFANSISKGIGLIVCGHIVQVNFNILDLVLIYFYLRVHFHNGIAV